MTYDKNYMKNILPKRSESSHKGTFGHVLNIAGSEFYTGAAYFSSISALKVGCGLVTLASAETVLRTVSALSPDIILMPIKKLFSNKGLQPLAQSFQAVSIGCGLSQEKEAVKLFKKVIKTLKHSEIPVVIDADGLNILSKFKINLPKNTILTPHPKELARLMGKNVENILEQPEVWVKKCCEKYNCTTVLKLHKTIVADNKGNFYENNTGNSALSHGGSGDVLTGMISGFLAQGMKTFDACCLAVYLHGLAGELASEDLTEYSTLASDLINYIPQAIKTII
jgi:NAD(P)H-hydrate epimerase